MREAPEALRTREAVPTARVEDDAARSTSPGGERALRGASGALRKTAHRKVARAWSFVPGEVPKFLRYLAITNAPAKVCNSMWLIIQRRNYLYI